MDNQIFDSLLKKAEKDHDFSLDTIGFKCEIGNYKINFYSTAPFKEVLVKDFGYTHKGEWVQMKPTEFQMEKLFEVIKLETLDHNKKNGIIPHIYFI